MNSEEYNGYMESLLSFLHEKKKIKRLNIRIQSFLFRRFLRSGRAAYERCRRRDDVKNRLEELRKAKGVKQEELASALEVSRQTIGSLENGRYNPSIMLAFKIARYFDLLIEDVFIYEEGEEK